MLLPWSLLGFLDYPPFLGLTQALNNFGRRMSQDVSVCVCCVNIWTVNIIAYITFPSSHMYNVDENSSFTEVL